jgi:hypothetical protein
MKIKYNLLFYILMGLMVGACEKLPEPQDVKCFITRAEQSSTDDNNNALLAKNIDAFVYDESGKLIRINSYSTKGDLLSYSLMNYNAQNEVEQVDNYSALDKKINIIKYFYNDKNQLIKTESYYPSDDYKTIRAGNIYEYNAIGQVIRWGSLDVAAGRYNYYRYEYYPDGNRSKRFRQGFSAVGEPAPTGEGSLDINFIEYDVSKHPYSTFSRNLQLILFNNYYNNSLIKSGWLPLSNGSFGFTDTYKIITNRNNYAIIQSYKRSNSATLTIINYAYQCQN